MEQLTIVGSGNCSTGNTIYETPHIYNLGRAVVFEYQFNDVSRTNKIFGNILIIIF